MFSKEELLAIEKKYLDNDLRLTVLINTMDGTTVKGIFTSQSLAKKYSTRDALNLTILSCEDEKDTNNFYYMMVENLDYYDMIDISTSNLDITKPIYVIQNGNYKVASTNPNLYLTNDYEKWKSHKITQKYLHDEDKWKNKCIVKIDPQLEEIDIRE